MPPQIRKMFQNTFKMIDETMRIWDFQDHLSTMAIDSLVCFFRNYKER